MQNPGPNVGGYGAGGSSSSHYAIPPRQPNTFGASPNAPLQPGFEQLTSPINGPQQPNNYAIFNPTPFLQHGGPRVHPTLSGQPQPSGSGYPIGLPSHLQQIPGPSTAGPYYHHQPAFNAPGGWGQVNVQDWEDEGHEGKDGNEGGYGPAEVKHRRRTTPDQLKVLEHWFRINPKPDNSMREWLAMELGMTKRNIQVWFQNRRAKVKSLALKERAAAEKTGPNGQPTDGLRTPPKTAPAMVAGDIQQQHQQGMLMRPQRPPVLHLQTEPHPATIAPMEGHAIGRRVSYAEGEGQNMEQFYAKQRTLGAARTGFTPSRSPTNAKSAMQARKNSIPYPSPIPENSPISPDQAGLRPSTSTLHLAAMRNNTRRASVPNNNTPAQLIASGPFTPPRFTSTSTNNANTGSGGSEDKQNPGPPAGPQSNAQNSFYFPDQNNLSTTYVTPPSSTYLPNTSPSSQTTSMNPPFDSTFAFSPTGPLPQAGFSFGGNTPFDGNVPFDPSNHGMMGQSPFGGMRDRMGSIASVNTYTTEGTAAESGSEWESDWMNAVNGNMPGSLGVPSGFEPDLRRASAPAELLQQLGVLGLGPNVQLNPAQAARLTQFGAGPGQMSTITDGSPRGGDSNGAARSGNASGAAALMSADSSQAGTNSGSGSSSSPHFVTPPFPTIPTVGQISLSPESHSSGNPSPTSINFDQKGSAMQVSPGNAHLHIQPNRRAGEGDNNLGMPIRQGTMSDSTSTPASTLDSFGGFSQSPLTSTPGYAIGVGGGGIGVGVGPGVKMFDPSLSVVEEHSGAGARGSNDDEGNDGSRFGDLSGAGAVNIKS